MRVQDSVTRNECTDTINNILDAISSRNRGTAEGKEQRDEQETLVKMYDITLRALKSGNNERLWFNTNIKMGRMYLAMKDFNKLQASSARNQQKA